MITSVSNHYHYDPNSVIQEFVMFGPMPANIRMGYLSKIPHPPKCIPVKQEV